jgi:NADH-quinone oxidoreductase subunit C
MDIQEPLDPIAVIQEKFPEAFQDSKLFRDETTIIVDLASLVAVIRTLRNTPGLIYNFLSDISAVDYYPDYDRPERFGVSYHIYSMLYNRRLRVKVYVPEEDPVVNTITGIFPGANWLEREIYDMMGIRFEGHPDLRRLLMPQDWDGHPHRRDYPLGYETIQFSFNAEEIMEHKPFATKD